MGELAKLPNIGKTVEEQLLQVYGNGELPVSLLGQRHSE